MSAAKERTGVSEAHPSHLAHHFDTPEQQFESGKLGMWIFLATEILLFGGLFCAYAVYRANHPEIFIYAHRFLDKTLGAINTGVLIFSSFTMALAVRAAQKGQRRALVALLAVTIACAFGFLGIKYVEYHHKWKEGLLWGAHYRQQVEGTTAVRPGGPGASLSPTPAPVNPEDRTVLPAPARPPAGLAKQGEAPPGNEEFPVGPPQNVQTFFAVYFMMTGLHGLHVIAGIVLLSIMLVRAARGEFGPEYFTPVDLAGLYWHVVDLIWIYLFPLLYLIH
ncbi:MAG: cytochrome c oxidase subunit 3 family protein [Acidobacteriota bacterium]